jgi:hypothetical protein
MAYTTINKGSSYFNGLAYSGNNTATAYNNGLDMSTNGGWVWLKTRSASGDHGLFDSVRGINKRMSSNNGTAEDTLTNNGVTSFNSTGFSLGTTAYNDTPYTFMSWSWIAGGTGVSNNSGSITSTVSANTTAGFSIVSWAGNQTAGASCGHGLGVVPKMIIKRRRNGDGADNWYVYTSTTGNSNSLYLDITSASAASGAWNSQTPTSTVFYHGSSIRENGNNMIAYCFAEVRGYSKFASYTGNGDANGTFVYTGFKPAFLIIKRSDSTSQWRMWDNKRNTYNVADTVLLPNDSGGDTTNSSQYVDFLSNGFKWRASYVDTNASGGTFIYMAFAENPFVTSGGIPVTAR